MTIGNARLALLNYIGACGAGALTAIGLLAYVFGGLLVAFPAVLLTAVAGPLTVAFLISAIWWKHRWRRAEIVQLLPFLVIFAWTALILLSPVQTHAPRP